MVLKIKNRDGLNGSFTIEAALIFPIIFITLIFIIQLLFISYKQVNLKALADESTELGNLMFQCSIKDDEVILNEINKYLDSFRNNNSTIISNVTVQKKLLNKYLVVNLSEEYNTLFGNITLKAKSKVHVVRQYNNIQSIDFFTDVIEDIPELNKYKQKYYEKVNQIKNKLMHFLE